MAKRKSISAADHKALLDQDARDWGFGFQLAFSMLYEIEKTDFEETAYDGRFRDGRPQTDIVAKYLAELAKAKDELGPRVLAAFTAVLTDHIASAMHAGGPCLENCQWQYARLPIPAEPVAQEVQS